MPVTEDPKIQDKDGRLISIRRLGPSQRMTIFELLGAALSDNANYLAYALTAACVTAINDQKIGFPARKSDILVTAQMLGDDGIAAVSKGYAEHFAAAETGDAEAVKN